MIKHETIDFWFMLTAFNYISFSKISIKNVILILTSIIIFMLFAKEKIRNAGLQEYSFK